MTQPPSHPPHPSYSPPASHPVPLPAPDPSGAPNASWSPTAGGRPPLLRLPEPRRVPPTDPASVLPEEYLLDSRRDLLRRLVRRSWAAALVLWPLWLCLVALYVLGTSPTFWLLSLLAAIADSSLLRQTTVMMGFSGGGLLFAFLGLPLLATALSLLLLSASAAWAGRIRPRELLDETAFQRAVSLRAALPLLAPAYAVIALLVLAVVVQAPLQWRGLSAGALSSLAMGIGLCLIAQTILRRVLSAPRLLGVPSPGELERTVMIGPRDERREAAGRLRAQDRRHLPPHREEFGPASVLRALRVTARGWCLWVVPAGLGLAWIVFAITDVVVLFSRLSSVSSWQQQAPAQLPWQLLVISVPLGALTALGLGLAPFAAIRTSRSLRGRVTDLRTHPVWSDRVAVNPWEGAVATRTGLAQAGVVLIAVVVLGMTLALAGALTAVGWVWLVLDVLVLVPFVGVAGTWAMRRHLRYVVYGRAGAYMRRRTPWAMVAPLFGTRADRADDPVVIAEIRRRRRAEVGEYGLEPVGPDPDGAAGHSGSAGSGGPGGAGSAGPTGSGAHGAPGVGDEPVGLPDFGAEDGAPTPGGGRRQAPGHAIPGSTTELRER
ncbi:hypothetical protein I8D64_06110 [Brachybacterium sp. MASK1Z-5]|uniref:Uncharacterized protein n=1 Tax=Brachybacterium halotolerans TaxID=2795215 RepID=A0ABS1B8J6_9MICO|nr:hypothetical protein [Brachybacterium halotolerans]MBK0330976.1 hypothetical protein [Brachybacterium halotolerans]